MTTEPSAGRAHQFLRDAGRERLRLVPSFLLVTLVGGLLTQLYQARTSDGALRAQDIAASRLAASKVHEDVSTLLGRRLYLLQQAILWPIDSTTQPFVSKDQITFNREWAENSDRCRALTCRFFGPVETTWLQDIVMEFDYVEGLRGLERQAGSRARELDSVSAWLPDARGGRDSLRGRMLRRLDSLSGNIYLLNLRWADRLRRGDFAKPTDSACATDRFRAFEESTAVLDRLKYLVQPRDTHRVARRRR
jgi:hypothetical protein